MTAKTLEQQMPKSKTVSREYGVSDASTGGMTFTFDPAGKSSSAKRISDDGGFSHPSAKLTGLESVFSSNELGESRSTTFVSLEFSRTNPFRESLQVLEDVSDEFIVSNSWTERGSAREESDSSESLNSTIESENEASLLAEPTPDAIEESPNQVPGLMIGMGCVLLGAVGIIFWIRVAYMENAVNDRRIEMLERKSAKKRQKRAK
jgi:hypothetical protein